MKNHPSTSILRTTFLIVFSIFLYSCGSFQPTSYYATDGIYSSDQQVQNTPKKQAPKSTEYSQYFNEKSKEYAWDESATDVYLTDVDNYTGNPANAAQVPQGQWGSAPQSTNVYVVGGPIDNRFNYLGYDPFFNNGFRFGFGNFGGGFYGSFGRGYNPYGWGFYNPYYAPYAYGFYDPYFYGGYPYNPYRRFNRFNNRNFNRVARNRVQPRRRSYSNSRRGSVNTSRRSNSNASRISATSVRRGNIGSRSTNTVARVPNLIRNSSNVSRSNGEEIRNYARRYVTPTNNNNIIINNNSSRSQARRPNNVNSGSNSNYYKPRTSPSRSNNFNYNNSSRSSNVRSSSSRSSSSRSSAARSSSSSRSSTSGRRN